LLGVTVGIILTVIPLYLIIKERDRGREFVIKLDGLKDASETSYGFENNSHGFLHLARYEDSRYGLVCVSTLSDQKEVICHQLNFTGELWVLDR
jgi:hypothetical protein